MSEWIDVADKKPEIGYLIDVAVEAGDKHELWLDAVYEEDGFFLANEGGETRLDGVTHWMYPPVTPS